MLMNGTNKRKSAHAAEQMSQLLHCNEEIIAEEVIAEEDIAVRGVARQK